MNDATFLILLFFMVVLSLYFGLKFINFSNLLTEHFDLDDLLVSNYRKKRRFSNKVVLIIESFHDLNYLLTLIRNILNQNFKVDSIILITKNTDFFKKVKLIHNTCILNQVGGLSMCLKESCKDTILIYIYPDGFNAFNDPNFLENYLKDAITPIPRDILKVDNNLTKVPINKVYDT
jgi:hypothetical protein